MRVDQFFGTAQTNYVRVRNVEAATAELEEYGLKVRRHATQTDAIMAMSGECGSLEVTQPEDESNDIWLSWRRWCHKHLLAGQVLLTMEVGVEDERQFIAVGTAINHKGAAVLVNLHDALNEAIKREFGDVPYAEVATGKIA